MAKVTMGGRSYDVEVRGTTVVVDGQEFPIKLRDDGAYTTVTAGSVQYRVQLPPEGERDSGMTAFVDYRPFVVEYEGRLASGPAPRQASAPRAGGQAASANRPAVKGAVSAQIAGRIITVKVKPGEAVGAGDVLLLLEAMKMENEIKAPSAGTVKEVLVAEGDRVSEGQALVVIE